EPALRLAHEMLLFPSEELSTFPGQVQDGGGLDLSLAFKGPALRPRHQSQKTARNAIRRFETMRMFRKGRFRFMVDSLTGGSEARFIGRLFQMPVA
ncbi:hypothetical protein, partial [Aureimonas pseudogalii]